MSYIMNYDAPTQRLKGSQGYVLNILEEYADENGICTLSYQDIAGLTDYSARTVAAAVKALVNRKIVRLTKIAGEKRNSYEVRNVYAQTSA